MVLNSIPDHFTVEFESSFDLKLQQMQTKLRGTVQERKCSGERVRLNRLGTVETTDIVTRGGDTVNTDITTEEPNIFPIEAEVSNLFDEFDETFLGQVVLPDSEVVQAHVAAVNRKIDNVIVAAATGTAYRGKNGTTATTFATSTNQVAVTYRGPTLSAANCGLNFYKIARAARILDDYEVPEEGRVLVLRAAQMEDLVNDVLANHANDFTSIKMLPGTRVITEILGFTVIKCQRVAVASATDIASVLAYQKDQIALGIWQDRKTRMDIRADKRHALQIRTTISVGATRKEELGVVEILCDQSP